MNKRASLSLSINAVVILVLAVTMLGLGLGFTKGMFGKLKEQLTVPPPDIPATASDPIVLPTGGELSIKAAKDAIFTVNFFNNGGTDDFTPDIVCGTASLGTNLQVGEQEVVAQEYRPFQMIIKADTFSGTTLGYNICTIKFYDSLNKLVESKQIILNAQ